MLLLLAFCPSTGYSRITTNESSLIVSPSAPRNWPSPFVTVSPSGKRGGDDLVEEQRELLFGHGAAGLRRAEEQFSADERQRVVALTLRSAPPHDRPVLCLRLDLLYRLKRRRDQGAEDHGHGSDSSEDHSLDHVQASFRALRRFEAVFELNVRSFHTVRRDRPVVCDRRLDPASRARGEGARCRHGGDEREGDRSIVSSAHKACSRIRGCALGVG